MQDKSKVGYRQLFWIIYEIGHPNAFKIKSGGVELDGVYSIKGAFEALKNQPSFPKEVMPVNEDGTVTKESRWLEMIDDTTWGGFWQVVSIKLEYDLKRLLNKVAPPCIIGSAFGIVCYLSHLLLVNRTPAVVLWIVFGVLTACLARILSN
jgi:hypothetical protein